MTHPFYTFFPIQYIRRCENNDCNVANVGNSWALLSYIIPSQIFIRNNAKRAETCWLMTRHGHKDQLLHGSCQNPSAYSLISIHKRFRRSQFYFYTYVIINIVAPPRGPQFHPLLECLAIPNCIPSSTLPGCSPSSCHASLDLWAEKNHFSICERKNHAAHAAPSPFFVQLNPNYTKQQHQERNRIHPRSYYSVLI